MSKDNVVPINQAILNKLSSAIEDLKGSCDIKEIDAVFINFDGFMLATKINYSGQQYWDVPKLKPLHLNFEDKYSDGSTVVSTVMRFCVDRYRSTETLIVFEQIE